MMASRSARGQGRGQAQSDPFGRQAPRSGHGRGLGESAGKAVPENIDIQRAQQILEELRERARELGRPQIELDYLERLLRRF